MPGDQPLRSEASDGRPVLSPGARQRLHDVRKLLPTLAVVWGGVFGAVAWSLDRAFGGAVLVLTVGLLVPPLVRWAAVERYARWMIGLTITVVLYIQATLLCVGLAAVSVASPRPMVLAVGLVSLALVAWRLPRDVKRFDAEWESHRAVNEGEILDLRAATYDLDRRFIPLTGGRRGLVAENSGAAAAVAARLTPVIAAASAVGSVLAGHGGGDFRVIALAALGPIATVGLTPALAQGVVHLRRLRGYERQLGRAIVNR